MKARTPDVAWREFVKASSIYQPAPSQSRLESLVEACINVMSGFLVSLAVWVFIAAPLFSIPVHFGQSLALTTLFTVSSVLRSYFWRRFFERDIHKGVTKWLRR